MKYGFFIIIFLLLNACKKTREPTAALPYANFSSYKDNCKAPCEVTFYNLTKGSFDTKYKWEFGDGDTSKIMSPRHLYKDAGKFNVRLTAINYAGETTLEKFIDIQKDIPVSLFSKCWVERIILKKYPPYKPNGSRWDEATTVDSLPDYIWILHDVDNKEIYRSDELVMGTNIAQNQLPFPLLRAPILRFVTDFFASITIQIVDDDIRTNDIMTEFKFKPVNYFPKISQSDKSQIGSNSTIIIQQDGIEAEVYLLWL
jgi:PKD domain